MPNRGSVNRRTGKTTPRNKVKTHWGAQSSGGSSRNPGKAAPSASSKK
jgi:hypothetical protein